MNRRQAKRCIDSKILYGKNRTAPLFKALLPTDCTLLPWQAFYDTFLSFGLDIKKDDRFAPLIKAWVKANKPLELDLELFSAIIQQSFLIIEQSVQGKLIIPDFASFSKELESIYHQTKDNHKGKVAANIPQLSRISPLKYGISVYTIDGQKKSFGDSNEMFSVQSTSKPISYCLALEEQGEEKVHNHVGREPSGHSYNELSLNPKGQPHNPMINAGAIMTSSMIKPQLSRADRFDYIIDKWSQLMGGDRPGFSNPTYLSEKETADRNFALGYFMREKKSFPKNTHLIDTLEFYFQCCALEVTCEMMSVLAATLANGGVCPKTNQRVLHSETVQRCLSLMYSCGMYDFSGEWAFTIGLPAKSGVSGAMIVVIPNVMGLCCWSPKLDASGNSIRGIEFCKALLDKYNFHNFDLSNQNINDRKIDPCRIEYEQQHHPSANLMWSVCKNRIREIRRLIAKGEDLTVADYDGRTALHIASAEGYVDMVKLLLSVGVPKAPLDRWGNAPLDDAKRGKFKEIISILTN